MSEIDNAPLMSDNKTQSLKIIKVARPGAIIKGKRRMVLEQETRGPNVVGVENAEHFVLNLF